MAKEYYEVKVDWWLLAVSAMTAVVLGMSGFYKYSIANDVALRLPDLLYRALKLFTLGSGELPPPIPLELEIARWLAPFVTFFAVIKGVLSLIHRQGRSLLQLRTLQQHAIICGLSRKGSHITKAILNRGQPVVVVERNAQNPHLSGLVQSGAIPVIGDACDPAILQRAKVHTARYLLATTDDDASNIGIIKEAQQLVSIFSANNSALQCYAHVADQTTKLLFYNHPLFSGSSTRFNAQLFNLYDRGARQLFAEYSPDCSRPIQSADDSSARILLFGLNPLAISLILHAARTGHYANGKKLVITVVDEHATRQVAALSLTTPALGEVIELTTQDKAIETLDTNVLLTLLSNSPDVIFLCADSDTRTMALARRLQYLLGKHTAPLVATLLQADTLADLLRDDRQIVQAGVHLFPLILNTSELDQILGEQQDRVSRLIHEMYCEDRYAHGETVESNSSLIPWDTLSECLKDSNRGQADHLPIKLRAIGITLEAVLENPENLSFTEAQIQTLSELEHRRWMADKLLDGWRYTEGKKDNTLKLNPLLVDFDLLPADEKHKDVQTIISIPHLIKLLKASLSGSQTEVDDQ